jgi:cytochrome P450
MDTYHMHHNEDVFPDSNVYKPERWLGNPKGPNGTKPLSRYLVAFGKGTRMCIGINMAYAELYLGIASLFRRFELDLFETYPADVVSAQDTVSPQPYSGSKGVRVMVLK